MIYTVDVLAKVVELSPNTIRQYLKHGAIKGARINGRWLIDGDEAERFVACRLFDNLHKGARIW